LAARSFCRPLCAAFAKMTILNPQLKPIPASTEQRWKSCDAYLFGMQGLRKANANSFQAYFSALYSIYSTAKRHSKAFGRTEGPAEDLSLPLFAASWSSAAATSTGDGRRTSCELIALSNWPSPLMNRHCGNFTALEYVLCCDNCTGVLWKILQFALQMWVNGNYYISM